MVSEYCRSDVNTCSIQQVSAPWNKTWPVSQLFQKVSFPYEVPAVKLVAPIKLYTSKSIFKPCCYIIRLLTPSTHTFFEVWDNSTITTLAGVKFRSHLLCINYIMWEYGMTNLLLTLPTVHNTRIGPQWQIIGFYATLWLTTDSARV